MKQEKKGSVGAKVKLLSIQRGTVHTDRLLGMKDDIVDAAVVARKFVDDPSGRCVPDVDESVC